MSYYQKTLSFTQPGGSGCGYAGSQLLAINLRTGLGMDGRMEQLCLYFSTQAVIVEGSELRLLCGTLLGGGKGDCSQAYTITRISQRPYVTHRR
jgi:hypothetical protein